ncbi:MAG TPA: hypothetical protein PLH23_16600 [Hyphomonadaceae bacterium]|nr:hypothetical protein [Hyphomonadaceae bacterium]
MLEYRLSLASEPAFDRTRGHAAGGDTLALAAATNVAPATDPFFEVIHEPEWNACVGSQGDEQNYVDGYMEAAVEIVSALLDKKMIGSRDTLAMPILYNARHAIELSLKFAIGRLNRMGAVHVHRQNHDILSHLSHLESARIGDEEIRSLVTQLKPFVISLAKIDQDGQELRYAKNANGKRSMAGIAIVNLPHIRTSLVTLKGVLERLKYRILDYERERSSGTFTNECSRSDLKIIAAMLGPHASWVEPTFLQRKAAVQTRFGLGSRKFSMAVDKIKKSRELAVLVNIETPLLHISDDKALFAIGEWAKRNPTRLANPKHLGLDFFERDPKAMEDHRRNTKELNDAITNGLTLEEQSDIEVLFYLGRDREHGEEYDGWVVETIAKHSVAPSRWEGVHHLMSKTSLQECVVKGATIAGRPSLAAKLLLIQRPVLQPPSDAIDHLRRFLLLIRAISRQLTSRG